MAGPMDRREVFRLGGTGGLALLLQRLSLAEEKPRPPATVGPIQYIRKNIPAFEPPKYAGQRYQASVPDTLDLQERAALAINGLTGPTDPSSDYSLYFYAIFLRNPPMMLHDFSAVCIAKFWEALPLMRIMSGSNHGAHVEKRWLEVMLHMQGPDGLAYFPSKGINWWKLHMPRPAQAKGNGPQSDHFAVPAMTGRQLAAMTAYYLASGDTLWRKESDRIVQGLKDLAIHRREYAYFPGEIFWAGARRDKKADMPLGIKSSLAGWAIPGLVQHWRASGYEPALELARKLTAYLRLGRYYDNQGRFLPDRASGFNHFHHHSLPLFGVLEYATAVKDRALLEWVRQGYEYGKANGNTQVGYFPENIGCQGHMNSEICEVADMIALGLKLTLAGMGDYWDDVDRWTRNQLAEGQLLHVDWVYRESEKMAPAPAIEPSWQTAEAVPERNIGCFAGWPSANDWFGGLEQHPFVPPQRRGMVIQHCCTGNGARALYYVWENILSYSGGKLRVNLLLNRASPWADVDSHIPYTGQVDVKIKKDLHLEIRMPEWVKPEEVRITVNGSARQVGFAGRYAGVGPVKTADKVTMTFPILQRRQKVFIEKKDYALVCKGNEVIDINPPGHYCPLYQRAQYRANETRWRKVTRFVAERAIVW